MTALSRRRFLQTIAAASTLPVWVRLADARPAHAASPAHHLLVIFLSGGNDGLNTVVPLRDSRYGRLRPRTALTSLDTVNLGNGFGLHRSLEQVHARWRLGQVAIIQGVGSPVADFSHFSAARVWDTGSPRGDRHQGWLGRYLDATPERALGPIRAVALSDLMPPALAGDREPAVTLRSLSSFDFVDDRMYDADARHEAFAIAASDVSGGMRGRVTGAHRRATAALDPMRAVAAQNTNEPSPAKTMAQLFAAGLGTEIGFMTIEGFDTHSFQRSEHANRLTMLDNTVAGFFAEAQRKGIADRSTVLVVSEFGRRVPDNRSAGTDHGHGNVAFLIGPRVRGGMHGAPPEFDQLVDGNLPARVDLRSLYSTVLAQVLAADPATVFSREFPTLPLIR